MAAKVTADPNTRIITITESPVNGLLTIDAIEEIYSALKVDWSTDAALQKLISPFTQTGGVAISATERVGKYIFLRNDLGWRMRPFDADHELRIVGNLFAFDPELPLWLSRPGRTITIQTERSSLASQLEQNSIQYSSYENGVAVDTTSPYSGTTFPVGTRLQPVNNLTDALAIANERGFKRIFPVGNLTINTGLDYSEKIFIGDSPLKNTLTVDTAANVLNCEFYSVTIQGILDGNSLARDCYIGNLTYVSGHLERCLLKGTITLGGGADAHILDCWDGLPGTGTPIIDMGGSGQNLNVRNYSGGLEIRNKTGSDEATFSLNGARLILDSTVSAGNILVRGVGQVVDNSTGTATVDDAYLVNPANIWDHLVEGTIAARSFIRRMAAALFGRTTGVGVPATPEIFKSMDGAKDRITMEYDVSGNRQNPSFDDS